MTDGHPRIHPRPAEAAIWDRTFATPDPWNYHSEYEILKYARTLGLCPSRVGSALEIGCAEGVFTERLAVRAERLLAVDISSIALERARIRCGRFANVDFEWCDIAVELPSGPFDLIVCSEILYYLQDRYALQDFARRAAGILKPGGVFVTANLNSVGDDPSSTGFDVSAVGARFIGETFARVSGLAFSLELRTPLYRIQRFWKNPAENRQSWTAHDRAPMEVIEKGASFEHSMIKMGGCVVTDPEARYCYQTRRIPILMYHRIAGDGPAGLKPYRVSPEAFAGQMQLLQRYGYRVVSVDEAATSYGASPGAPRPGKLLALTFDDGYRDFLDAAWPILKRFGFSATVYLPTDFIGGRADWDEESGEPAPLLTWDQVRALSAEGVRFGSHGASHQRLTKIDEGQMAGELNGSRDVIVAATGQAVTSFCYAFGDFNAGLRRKVADAGYAFALAADLTDPSDLWALPRIDVPGGSSLEQFFASLPQPEAAPDASIMEYRRLRTLKDRRLYTL